MLRATFHPRRLGSIADHDLRGIVKHRVEVAQGLALIAGGVIFSVVAVFR
jgi:hypothetical protein